MKQNVDELKYMEKWETIPQVLFYLNITVGLITISTLFRQIS
jgi:hypothetical protein